MQRLYVLLAVVISLLFVSVTNSAEARSRRLGLGIVVAGPTGLTAEYFYAGGRDIAASVGWGANYFHLNLDHHWNNRNWIKADGVAVNVYYGIGLRWLSYQSRAHDSEEIGARTPFGVQHIFKPSGIQVFFELAPGLVLTPATNFIIDLALGARYFF